MTYTLLISIIILLISCKQCPDSKVKEQKDNYIMYETLMYGDCSLYKMVFNEGIYSFRFALSGKCEKITKDDYIVDCKSFVEKFKNEISFEKNKYIRFEYYKELKIDDTSICKIISIMENISNKKIILKERWEEGFDLKIE